ncbi:succinylglutamate desuccinylase/aspartoacylase family protein [Paucibacter soli]|uniref:succinylglutamate desuccinylase/aspartoacylase family protein n=1 Tax=Paucibacter soli TaxID=3133433 RepID=UPI0030B24975
MKSVLHALPAFSAGTTRSLRSLHFGPAGGGVGKKKAYLQASLHADEVPAMLVAQHLRRQLQALEEAGQLRGEIVLVPMANPIGLAQDLQGTALGRFDLSTGINFNRHYKSLTAALIPMLETQLGADAAANTLLIRRAALQLLQAWEPATETEALKQRLQCLAMDADIVLDLHCDNQAVLHLYTGTPLAAQATPLARYLGAQALLTSASSGDDPFDETVARIWWELGAHFAGRFPVPQACFAATLELRGEAEVEHGLAARDASALIEWLRHEGLVEGTAAPQPPALCAATPLEGVEPVTAPHSGLLVFLKAPGETVQAGETIAELLDPLSDQSTPLRASVSGTLFARVARRYATRGMRVAKIAGSQAYRSGKLLSL